ncbi:TPA: hypothetical protein ACX3CZ_000736 [Vibrio parahaemolyticus]|uniref:hypothetical protein n=1 Tax=Vibrio parahaemolyticus TaxID=670 RepID=UPI003B66EEDD
MKAPSPDEIRLDAGLPESASFHGWLIHNPEQDDFLLKANDHHGALTFAWCPSPESAKRYNRFSRAYKALNSFELEDRAIIVASFDIGRQIIVIAPKQFHERLMTDSNNPFRASDLLKH